MRQVAAAVESLGTQNNQSRYREHHRASGSMHHIKSGGKAEGREKTDKILAADAASGRTGSNGGFLLEGERKIRLE